MAHILYYAGLVGFCLTGQVFSLVWSNPLLTKLGLMERFLIVLTFLVAPVLLFVAVDRALDRFSPLSAHRLRLLLPPLAVLLFANQWRYFHSLNLHHLSWILKAAVILAAGLLGWLTMTKWSAQVRKMFQMLGAVTIIMSVYFLSAGPLTLPHQPLPLPRSTAGPVVILMFDSLSADALLDTQGRPSSRFPHFQRLAEEGYGLPHAYTNYDHTALAIPTFLTGNPDSGPRDLARERTFFDIVGDSHACHLFGLVVEYCELFAPRPNCRAIDHSTYLAKDRDLLLRRFFRSWSVLSLPHFLIPRHADIGYAWLRLLKRLTPEVAEDFLESLSNEDLAGHIFYLHLLSPHMPYLLDSDGAFQPDRPRSETQFGISRTDTAYQQTLAYYREEIDYDDRILGRVIEILEKRQAWDSAVLVVTSDHGVCWRQRDLDRQNASRDSFLSAQTARIPFFLKPPSGWPALPDSTIYQHHRFASTLLDLLGVPVPPELAPSLYREPPGTGRQRNPVLVGTKSGVFWRLQADTWVRGSSSHASTPLGGY